MENQNEKTGIELIAEERARGYNHLREEDFPSDFKAMSAGVAYAYSTKSDLRIELLTKAAALIAGEIDRLIKTHPTKNEYTK